MDVFRLRLAKLAVLAMCVTSVYVAVIGYGAAQLGPTSVGAYTTSYDGRVLDDPLELLIVQSDGQAFASLARDPLLRRPEVFRSEEQMVYRAQRPLISYGAWALSLGRTGWVPPALAAIAIVGVGMSVAGLGALLERRGARPEFALLTLLLPGFATSLAYFGPEPIGLGLAVWGLVRWERGGTRGAVALFAVAALSRETMLIVPGVLFLRELLGPRRPHRLAALIAAPAAYGTWIGVLWLRLRALPTDVDLDALSLPFVGLLDGLRNPIEGTEAGNVTYLALYVTLGVIAAARAPRDATTQIALAFLAFGTLMGGDVWQSWVYFGRVLLPAGCLALVAIASTLDLARQAEEVGDDGDAGSALAATAQEE